MSAAMLLQAWGDTMLTTAVLVLLVLIVRKPFARHFGPRLTYALWAVPALRLVLPPLPFADPVIVTPAVEVAVVVPADLPVAAPASAAEPLWSLAGLTPFLFAVWAAGMAAVLVAAIVSHRRFRREVLSDAVELEPIGKIRLIMSDAVDGPVAFGLWQRHVAVPHDFFARYVAEERALAIDHELSHHRHGDLWANSAALVLLAAQWFNPFAWRAIRAFRFDQEAACDARVLRMGDREGTDRAASYATAIVKAAVGPRLSLAAPMAVHDNLQERLTMLTQRDISKKRGLAGRLLVGGATLAVLATTATLVPAGIVVAKAQTADVPAPPAPPEAPLPPEAPPEVLDAPGVMVFTEHNENVTTGEGGTQREVHRIVIREDGEKAPAAMSARIDGKDEARRIEIRTPGSLSRDDVLATLKEQGISGKRAEAIADRLEAKRKERIRTVMAPLPPMPPLPPIAHGAWTADGKTRIISKCGDGKPAAPIVKREEADGSKRSSVYMFSCGDTAASLAAHLSALKKTRESFAQSKWARAMSEDMRAKIAADLDKAMADLEKSGH
ncbi:Peptidase M56, BlaR1 [uncultured Sphingopyxis sp.]|uniref:Peptidase M56, BlaR1 n=1 Tax=uncultured Sphingopyxis sp. TaxID=310581 RepID=A0A1Y5PUX5_9SPHN|nr:M56 family metallopeptidase [uncultured Sphingopyxis sp.]SBV33808.1 Peptidase M56, BlaR1 [uncultured Sphingopyxis sp.]